MPIKDVLRTDKTPENVKGRVRAKGGERGSLKGGRNGKKGELEAPVWRVHNRRQRCGSGSKLMILRKGGL